tara:strand:- start:740 stop:886 length:147 start_codon:yes stop_codon:yes gene_type:complete
MIRENDNYLFVYFSHHMLGISMSSNFSTFFLSKLWGNTNFDLFLNLSK